MYSKPFLQLETGLRPNSAGIPYTLLLRIEAYEVSNCWASTVYEPSGVKEGSSAQLVFEAVGSRISVQEP